MKKIGILPVILLGLSTLALVAMFASKLVQNQSQLKQSYATHTAAVASQWAEQTIAAIPTETPLPTATFTPEPTATPEPPTETPAATATQELVIVDGCDEASFVADISIPDGIKLKPETEFTKTWRLMNTGTCTWTSFYKLYFVSGDRMSGPDSQQLVGFDVPPGTIIEISVDLKTSKYAGHYRGYWAMKNTNGQPFGIGPDGDPFYVDIVVEQ